MHSLLVPVSCSNLDGYQIRGADHPDKPDSQNLGASESLPEDALKYSYGLRLLALSVSATAILFGRDIYKEMQYREYFHQRHLTFIYFMIHR